MGNEADLRALVEGAHQRGIRILFDVVMNHTGYATLADMQEYQFGALYLSGDELKTRSVNAGRTGSQPPGKAGTALMITSTSAIKQVGKNGGENWIRTDIGDYDNPGFDDLTMSLAFLPDLKTESTTPSGLPNFISTNQIRTLKLSPVTRPAII